VLGVPQQALDHTKHAVIILSLSSQASISLLNSSQAQQIGEVWMGPDSDLFNTGVKIAEHRNIQSGTLVVTLVLNQQVMHPVAFLMPKNWYYGVRQTVGANLTIGLVMEQSIV
jgi:hypothetical protein